MVATATVLVVIAALVGWQLIEPSSSPPESSDPTFEIYKVKRGDLSVGISLAGNLGYGAAKPIPLQVSGTVTWLPGAGDRAEVGDTLIKVDNRPVVLMYGATPAYRAMDAGSVDDPTPPSSPADSGDRGQGDEAAQEGEESAQSGSQPESRPAAVGPDVEQLERGLSALGYTGFDVNEEYTIGTAAAVREWQEDLGVMPTGRVEFGDVVFLTGPIRLQPDADALGLPVSETSVQQTGTTMLVTVETDDVQWAERGVEVQVTLPNHRTATGRVVSVAAGSESSEMGGSGMQEVRIGLNHPRKNAGTGPVTVRYVSAEQTNVLIVPVTSLVALAEGGYAVELADGQLVGVKPGLYADGFVEVTGDLEVGTEIRGPS